MLAVTIARRYFLSKRSQRVINIISWISVFSIMIGTAALIIVLSVFNGFEDLITRLYNSFDPDIKVTAAHGKAFERAWIPFDEIKKIDGVKGITEVVEESGLIKYRDKQTLATIKGVSTDFEKNSGLDSMMADGKFILSRNDTNYAVVGAGIAYNLQLNLQDPFSQLEIYAPRRMATSFSNPEEAFNQRYISPTGVFSIQQEFDIKYILVSLNFAKEIFEYDHELTGIEIVTDRDKNLSVIKEKVSKLLGNRFQLKDRYEQHESINKILKSEKWAVFLILTFILIIATFNVVSSLTMLVIDKKKDIAILHAMGADKKMLRRIFLTEGFFITLIGAGGGLLIGFITCFVQERFGLIQISGSGSFIIDAYPVKMITKDFISVFITVTVIGMIAAWYPGRKLINDTVSLKAIAEE